MQISLENLYVNIGSKDRLWTVKKGKVDKDFLPYPLLPP